MRTAIVHDWLTQPGGAEKVLEAIHSLYPSPIYTLVKGKGEMFAPGSFFSDKEVYTSFIQHLPFSPRFFRHYLMLFPSAIERLDLKDFDVILSSSYCVSKGVLKKPHQLHICYCHTPVRYAWDLREEYLRHLPRWQKVLAVPILNYLRTWDRSTEGRVDHFIANSKTVAARIKRHYNREATVIYPPVATHVFEVSVKREEYYITLSRLIPYKKIGLIVEAFGHMPDKKLVVIGDGPEIQNIRAKAKKNCEILGYIPNAQAREYLCQAKAFVFAAEEDFGIAPVEAQAAGIPVIAFGKGGVTESVIEGKTGLFFKEQTVESIVRAVAVFEKKQEIFDPHQIKAHAEQFNSERFKLEFKGCVENHVRDYFSRR